MGNGGALKQVQGSQLSSVLVLKHIADIEHVARIDFGLNGGKHIDADSRDRCWVPFGVLLAHSMVMGLERERERKRERRPMRRTINSD
jgi:hypothetical protein